MTGNNPEARSDEERDVLRFFDLWEERRTDEIVAFFAEEASYVDMPLPPRNGISAIRAYIDQIFSAFDFRIETLRIASQGAFVFTERLDHINPVGDTAAPFPLPIVGVMRMEGGKIAEWRDYFDVLTAEEGLGVKLRPGA